MLESFLSSRIVELLERLALGVEKKNLTTIYESIKSIKDACYFVGAAQALHVTGKILETFQEKKFLNLIMN